MLVSLLSYSSLWLAKRRDTLVLSLLPSRKISSLICSIGVIPVPPASMPTCFTDLLDTPPPCDFFRRMSKTPCPWKRSCECIFQGGILKPEKQRGQRREREREFRHTKVRPAQESRTIAPTDRSSAHAHAPCKSVCPSDPEP